MKRSIRIIAVIALVLTASLCAAAAVSAFISPPSAGQKIAAMKKIIPHAVAAHRGASYFAPENTLPSFALARELGADYLECDLQRTRDGKLVIFHDSDLSRTTDAASKFPGREKDGVGEFTLNELSALDCGSWFIKTYPTRARESFKGLKICSFEEYIDAAGSAGLLIELKNPSLYPGIEQQAVDMLRAKGRLNRIASVTPDIIQSFDRESLRRLHSIIPELRLVYLVTTKGGKDTHWDSRGWQGICEDAAAMNADIGASGYLGWPWYTGRAHRTGLLVIHWTVDVPWQMRLFSFFGMDWVITNRSDLALDYYGRKPAESADAILVKLGY